MENALNRDEHDEDVVFVDRPGEPSSVQSTVRPTAALQQKQDDTPPLQVLMGEADALFQQQQQQVDGSDDSVATRDIHEDGSEEEDDEEDGASSTPSGFEFEEYDEEPHASPEPVLVTAVEEPGIVVVTLAPPAPAKRHLGKLFAAIILLWTLTALFLIDQMSSDIDHLTGELEKWHKLYAEMEERNYLLETELHQEREHTKGRAVEVESEHSRYIACLQEKHFLERKEHGGGGYTAQQPVSQQFVKKASDTLAWAADQTVRFGKWATAPENSWSAWANTVKCALTSSSSVKK